MISYLSTVQSLVDPSVYGRGIRLFLEGRIGLHQELPLDFWREYEVIDKTTYTVTIPVLHLAVNPSKWDFNQEILKRFAKCECEYFQEMGICKHIVAVCASLEKEFVPSKAEILKTTPEIQSEIDAVLDRVFEVEQEKQSRVWLQKLEMFFQQSSSDIAPWMREMVTNIASNPQEFQDTINTIKYQAQEATSDYLKEKRLIRFIIFTLQFGNQVWWDIWTSILDSLEKKHTANLILELWDLYLAGLMRDYSKHFISWLISLSPTQKEETIYALQNKYQTQSDKWLQFVFLAQSSSWLKQNYRTLDPINTLRAAPIIPELDEEIQEHILHQTRLWTDFITPSQQDELINVFNMWREILGRSSYYEEAVKYVSERHPKKRKLLSSIDQ